MSNQTEWRWADPTGQQRLVREDELRAGIATGLVPANAPVWTRGWKEWKPAHDVAELSGPPANGALEGKPVPTGPAEPPPPPRYVPKARSGWSIPPGPSSVTEVDAKRPAVAKPPTPPAVKPKSAPPPLPAKAKSSGPPPLPTKPTTSAKPPLPATTTKPMAKPVAPTPAPKPVTPTIPQASPFKHTQRPPMGVAPPSEELSPTSSRMTLPVAPAPPPLPRIAPVPAPEPTVKMPQSKYPTLMMFEPQDGTPAPAPEPKPAEAPPIVVPPNEPSARVNAVTKPPPWGEGAVAIDPGIPKAPGVPNMPAQEERPSQAPPRPVELSSSDLTSEASMAAAVKAPPLAPAERPQGTMAGIGPDVLAQNRAVIERAATPPPMPARASVAPPPVPPPMPPMSQSDMATNKWAPLAAASAARIHDMREVAQQRVKRAVDSLKERTKDKPPWVLPVVAASGVVVTLILLAVVVKTAVGAIAGSSSSASASASGGPNVAVSAPVVASAPVKPPAAVRPMTCRTSAAARSIAPKALVASGVEVAAVGGQLALGFAVTPKEAEVALLDGSASLASSMRLKADAPIRRVLALDSSRATVDSDKKGDALQGRRTMSGSPPIDVGAMDGGIAWAPHGTDKGIKLWSLANADQRIEALRGVPLASGGYAIAFRQGHTIWYGAFGGNPPAPMGELGHVDGLGPQVGSPAIAASGDRVMIAWADRDGTDSPWGVRYVIFATGKDQPAAQPKTFSPPAGGPGEEAMSPGLASLDAGRFLLVWTEGPKSDHQVRGVVVGRDDTMGDAFTASTDGVNAGQGQAAVLPDGKGVVAFLSASPRGKGFEVAATSIACTEK